MDEFKELPASARANPVAGPPARRPAIGAGVLIAAVASALLVTGCGRDPAVPGQRPPAASTTDAAHLRISGRLLAVGGPAGVKAEPMRGAVTAVNVRTGRSYAAAAHADGRYAMHVPPGRYRLVGRSPQYLSGAPSCRGVRPIVMSQRAAAPTADVLCQRR